MKKKIIVSALVVAGVAVLAVGSYYTYLITPPGLPKTAEEGLSTIGTGRYERMPEYRKEEYLAQTRELVTKLPQEDRHKLFERVRTDESLRRSMREYRRSEMEQRVEAYVKASPEERIRILDEDIDRWERMRAQRPEGQRSQRPEGQAAAGADRPRGPGDRGPGARGQRGGSRADRQGRMRARMQRRVEQGNPQRAALMREYFEAVRARRAERGLPAFRGPGGRPGGRPGGGR